MCTHRRSAPASPACGGREPGRAVVLGAHGGDPADQNAHSPCAQRQLSLLSLLSANEGHHPHATLSVQAGSRVGASGVAIARAEQRSLIGFPASEGGRGRMPSVDDCTGMCSQRPPVKRAAQGTGSAGCAGGEARWRRRSLVTFLSPVYGTGTWVTGVAGHRLHIEGFVEIDPPKPVMTEVDLVLLGLGGATTECNG